MPQTRFTTEFQDEAVRLALTSGRSRRAIAADLGVGLSTCVFRMIVDPAPLD
ncbi:transposase [Microvirga lotononidis]|uniref:transposase n=1 Tax=Microvirga TaxID=186650 RepID=UPI003898D6F7